MVILKLVVRLKVYMSKNSIFLHFLALSAGLTTWSIKVSSVNAAIINVPFTWKLKYSGAAQAQALVYNDGPANTPKSDSKTLTALIKVFFEHTPPENAARLDPLPESTILNITGNFSGKLGGTCVAFISDITGFDCYSKANANLTSPVSFTPSEQQERNTTVNNFDIPLNNSLNVGAGDYPVTGTVSVNTLFGLGIGNFGDNVFGDATLKVGANFFPGVQTKFNIRYEQVPEPIPEPLTVLGTGAALGFGAVFKRQHSKKLQKQKV
jgi:hypothetical protein